MAGLVAAIALPDGTPVRGRGRREPLPPGPLPEFGLYLGKPGRWQPDWPAEWVDWPDFRLPRDPEQAAASIAGAYEQARAGRRVRGARDTAGSNRAGHARASRSHCRAAASRDAYRHNGREIR